MTSIGIDHGLREALGRIDYFYYGQSHVCAHLKSLRPAMSEPAIGVRRKFLPATWAFAITYSLVQAETRRMSLSVDDEESPKWKFDPEIENEK